MVTSSEKLGAAGSPAKADSEGLVLDPDYARIEEIFAGESQDQAWTSSLRDYLSTSFADLNVGGGVHGVSCHQTLCKVELDFATPLDATRFAENADYGTAKWLKLVQSDRGLMVDLLIPRHEKFEP